MKKWQFNLMAIASTLGFSEKVKEGNLTSDDQKLMFAEYQKEHNISFADDKLKNEDMPTPEVLLTADEIASLVSLTSIKAEDAPKTQAQAVTVLSSTVKTQQQQIEKLVTEPEVVTVAHVQMGASAGGARMLATVLGHTPHSATHLFGIEHDSFSRNNWWNQITATRIAAGTTVGLPEKQLFMDAFHSQATDLAKRAVELESNNQLSSLDYKQMIAGEGHVDYSSLTDTLGEYRVRRNDLILAYFRTIPSVAGIFPVVSNVQNKEDAPTATFQELSQGYREGRIFKGGVEFAAEVYSVIDVMFKYQFSDLIKLDT